MTTSILANGRLAAAIGYAELGWRVMPVHTPDAARRTCSCGNAGCGSAGKHPRTRNGLKDATTDPNILAEWWRRWPTANVGIVTGAESGIVVLDVDPAHGGTESLRELMDSYGEIPETVEAGTGGGGLHLVFRHPGRKVANSVGANGWLGRDGLDVRGDGGYIVASPSVHITGGRYVWKTGAGPAELSPSDMPGWLLAMVPDPASSPAAVAPARRPSPKPWRGDLPTYWLGKALAKATNGNRNETGLWLAAQLRDAGLSESQATSVLMDYQQRCPRGDDPYTEAEARSNVKSAYTRPPRSPAHNPSPPAKKQPGAVPLSAPQAPEDESPSSVVQAGDGNASGELRAWMDAIVTGGVANVPWPWPVLTKLAAALIPGTITLLCGDGGVGKTFFVLQCAEYWDRQGVPFALLFIEKDRKFHTMRMLAQLEGNGRYVDYEWIKNNPEAVSEATAKHRDKIDRLGQYVHQAKDNDVSLDSLLGWVRDMCAAGKRVIVIDPVTAADTGQRPWDEEKAFVKKAQAAATQYGASIVLVTHPKKGKRIGPPGPDDLAGGAAYYRFTDTVIWLHKPKRAVHVRVKRRSHYGHSEELCIHCGLFFQIHKCRNGRGGGQEIAFNFGEGLLYAEQGLVIGDADDSPQPSVTDPFSSRDGGEL